MRILLLLVVAGAAIGIAGALFSGGETAARNPAAAETTPPPPGSAPATSPSPNEDTPDARSVVEEDSASDAVLSTTADDAAAPTTPDDSPTATTGTIDPPEPVDDAETSSSAAVSDEPAASEAAAQLIEQLQPLVAERNSSIPDYDRDYFAGWLDTDRDCVNTRHEILQTEAVDFSMNAEGCAVDSGEWFDPYTSRTFTDPRDLDVDHVVALADAWVSGAWEWADEVLDRFSNDLGNLNAIAAGENRSKSARGPAEYTPTSTAARCDYLVQYATVKIRWGLSITPQDFDVVATGLSGCDVGIVPDASPAAPDAPPAAPDAPSAETPPTTSTTQAATDCHPAYEPCLPNLPGDALNCGDLRSDQKPVTVLRPGEDPYRLDRDRDGRGCTG